MWISTSSRRFRGSTSHRVFVMTVLGAALPLGAVPPVRADNRLVSLVMAPVPPGPFADVPPRAPAYQVANELRTLGLPFDQMGCWGPRALTRYEFAVVTQRMLETMRTAVRYVGGDSGPGPNFGAPVGALEGTITDARVLQQATFRLDALIREFRPELQLLADQPESLLAEVARWHAEACALAESARKAGLSAAPRAVKHSDPKGKR